MSTPVAGTELALLQADFQDLVDQRSVIESRMEGMHERLIELSRTAALEDFSSQPFPKSIASLVYFGLDSEFVAEAMGLEGDVLERFMVSLEALEDTIVVELLINEDLSFSFGPTTIEPREESEIE